MPSLFVCCNRTSLEKILPHRGAALGKIDGVFYSCADSCRMIGTKVIAADDRDLEGHFPGAPTYPGYAQDEFICLVAAALLAVSDTGLRTKPYVVQKKVRYKRNAVPGDILIAEVELIGRIGKKGRFVVFSGVIKNQKQELVVYSGEFRQAFGFVSGTHSDSIRALSNGITDCWVKATIS